MKIKHNLKILKDWVTIKWQILDVLFEELEERGDEENHFTKDWKFYISSSVIPQLYHNSLFVWWDREVEDNKKISYTYSSREEAQQVLDYINKFTIKEEPHYVYVSDESVEDALEHKEKRILLHDLWEQFKYRYIVIVDDDKEKYLNWEKYINWHYYDYIAEIPKEEAEQKIEVSMQEIADKFWIDKAKLLIKE